jgi:hypothetical protein
VCLNLRSSGDRLRRLIPALLGQNISYSLLRDGVRCTRVSIFKGCEEILGEVVLRRSRCSAGARAPCDGDGREHESEKAERRDGKESMHAYLKKDNKVHGLRAAYSIGVVI